MAVTLDRAKKYMKIDYTEEDEDVITPLIETSLIYLDGMVGEEYKTDPKAVKLAELVQLKFINDMYENRSAQISDNVKQDRIVSSILDKLSNYEVVV